MVIIIRNWHGYLSSISEGGWLHFTLRLYLPTMGKQLGRLDSLTFVWQPISEKEKFEFKPVKVHSKIDFGSHPSHSGGIGQILFSFSLQWIRKTDRSMFMAGSGSKSFFKWTIIGLNSEFSFS